MITQNTITLLKQWNHDVGWYVAHWWLDLVAEIYCVIFPLVQSLYIFIVIMWGGNYKASGCVDADNLCKNPSALASWHRRAALAWIIYSYIYEQQMLKNTGVLQGSILGPVSFFYCIPKLLTEQTGWRYQRTTLFYCSPLGPIRPHQLSPNTNTRIMKAQRCKTRQITFLA